MRHTNPTESGTRYRAERECGDQRCRAGHDRHGDRQDVVGEQSDAGDLCRHRPKLSRVTMYVPPAVGYALIVSRF